MKTQRRKGQTILDFAPECSASIEIHNIFDKLMKTLEEL